MCIGAVNTGSGAVSDHPRGSNVMLGTTYIFIMCIGVGSENWSNY